MFIQGEAEIIKKFAYGENYYHFVIKHNDIAHNCKPGQFIHIKVSDTVYPILRRPISICDCDGESLIELFFKVVGTGTDILSRRNVGERLDIIGPLGNPFEISTKDNNILVGGGIGIAPLAYLAKELNKMGKKIIMFYGGRTASDIMLTDKFKYKNSQLVITTEDGTLGLKGMITEEVEKYFTAYPENCSVYVCGPEGMLRALSKVRNLPFDDVQISLENRMACGVGACQGCAIKTINGKYQRVCKEGPVFKYNEIIL